jgi:hypothetical protein
LPAPIDEDGRQTNEGGDDRRQTLHVLVEGDQNTAAHDDDQRQEERERPTSAFSSDIGVNDGTFQRLAVFHLALGEGHKAFRAVRHDVILLGQHLRRRERPTSEAPDPAGHSESRPFI